MTERAAIALGSNIEDPEAQVTRAFDELDALPGTRVLARSKLRRATRKPRSCCYESWDNKRGKHGG